MTTPQEIIQRTPEWYKIRLGKVTASRVVDVMAKTKSGWGASRANYMAQLICERLTNTKADSYQSKEMELGSTVEPSARAAYEFFRNVDIAEVGFVPHPILTMSGASPDGFVGADGQVEIKCPNTATHIETLLGGSIPGKYVTQMQWQMACTGRKWVDFVSYDERMPQEMVMFNQRVERDDVRIKELENAIADFLGELDKKEQELRSTYQNKTQAAA